MATTLYMIRHGEADVVGGADPKLTPRGREQAESVGRRLRSVTFDLMLFSQRRRAVNTAAIVATAIGAIAPRHSAHADDRTPVPPHDSAAFVAHRAFFESVPPEERDVDGHRLDESIAALGRAGEEDRRLRVVMHNFVIGWFVRDALNAPSDQWMGLHSATGSLTIISYQPHRSPRLLAFNDTRHLPVA